MSANFEIDAIQFLISALQKLQCMFPFLRRPWRQTGGLPDDLTVQQPFKILFCGRRFEEDSLILGWNIGIQSHNSPGSRIDNPGDRPAGRMFNERHFRPLDKPFLLLKIA